MRIISHEDIVRLGVSPLTCYRWVEEMIEVKGETVLPAKTGIAPPGNTLCNIMPAIIPYGPEHILTGGVKIVTRYPFRAPELDSKIVLLDQRDGEFKAMMDANWITAMRTGAVAAHSIKLFAREGFANLGMMGLGNVSRAVLLVLAELFPEKKFHIKLLAYKGQEKLFAQRFSDYGNFCFQCVKTAEETVQDSDVVISAATYFEKDVCADHYFAPGVLVVPIHTRGFMACDLTFDKIFADDENHVRHFQNFDRFRYFSEVSDVVNGRRAGRESDEERILAYNIGISIHDVNFAAHIFELLSGEGGPEIDFCEPAEKFWV